MPLCISSVELRKSDEYQQSQNITLTGRTALFKQILGAVNSSEFENQFGNQEFGASG
jgi:exocyst complex component 2